MASYNDYSGVPFGGYGAGETPAYNFGLTPIGGYATPAVTGQSIAGFGGSSPSVDPTAVSSTGFTPNTTLSAYLGGAGSTTKPPTTTGPKSSSGLGFNMDTMNLVLGGVETIGKLWMAWEANKLAKKAFEFQKAYAQRNLTNQVAAYNTTMEGQENVRGHWQGDSPETIAQYKVDNRLSDQINVA